ncbi:MAG: AAA family ATPase, partial [Candidatus Dormibacteria bacterium]
MTAVVGSLKGNGRLRPALDMPAAISAADLATMTFAPIRWIVPDYIPDGLTILAGKPKSGKSWMVLDIAAAVARGGYALGNQAVVGDVLYGALEDAPRRLKGRMGKLMAGAAWPGRLQFWTGMERLEAGGLDQLRQWIATAPGPRLIVLDTFAKVRSPKGRDEGPY